MLLSSIENCSFQYKSTESNFTPPFEIPNTWTWVRLGDICEMINGYAFKSNLFSDNGLKIIKITNIKEKQIETNQTAYYPQEYKNLLQDYLIKQNDILIAMSGATTGKVGVYNYDTPAYLNQRVGLIRINNQILRKYVFCYLVKISEINLKKSLGTAQPNLSTFQILNTPIPLPPLKEQQEIARILESLFTLTKGLRVE